jgi:hypothetical protein
MNFKEECMKSPVVRWVQGWMVSVALGIASFTFSTPGVSQLQDDLERWYQEGNEASDPQPEPRDPNDPLAWLGELENPDHENLKKLFSIFLRLWNDIQPVSDTGILESLKMLPPGVESLQDNRLQGWASIDFRPLYKRPEHRQTTQEDRHTVEWWHKVDGSLKAFLDVHVTLHHGPGLDGTGRYLVVDIENRGIPPLGLKLFARTLMDKETQLNYIDLGEEGPMAVAQFRVVFELHYASWFHRNVVDRITGALGYTARKAGYIDFVVRGDGFVAVTKAEGVTLDTK